MDAVMTVILKMCDSVIGQVSRMWARAFFVFVWCMRGRGRDGEAQEIYRGNVWSSAYSLMSLFCDRFAKKKEIFTKS